MKLLEDIQDQGLVYLGNRGVPEQERGHHTRCAQKIVRILQSTEKLEGQKERGNFYLRYSAYNEAIPEK